MQPHDMMGKTVPAFLIVFLCEVKELTVLIDYKVQIIIQVV